MALGSIVPWLYMAIFMVIGWRLYSVGWPLWRKVAAAAVMVIVPPILFALPALRDRGSDTAGLSFAVAFAMLLMGSLCLLGGVGATWLRERTRGKR